MKCFLLILHPSSPLILWIVSLCVHLFQIFWLMFMRIRCWMDFLLINQTVISFAMSIPRSQESNKNLWWRVILFLPHYPDIVPNSVILVESCENSLSDRINTSNNSQNSRNGSFSSKRREVEFSITNLSNSSSFVSWNIEAEICHFSSSPLYDSSNHEDSIIDDLEFSKHGCVYLLTDLAGHNADFSTVDFSKPSISDDLPYDEVELPQAVKTLQPKLMVMSSSRRLEVSSIPDQNNLEPVKPPHVSTTHIEDLFVLQFSHPPSIFQDLITQSFEESYLVSTKVKQRFIYFFMFHWPCSSKFFPCKSSTRSVSGHYDITTKCLPCNLRSYFSVCSFKLWTFWFRLGYLSCFMCYLNIFS